MAWSSPIAHVEAGLGSSGGTTGSMDSTGANFLVAALSRYAPGGGANLSDSKANTWIPLTEQIFSFSAIKLYYCVSPSVGSGHTFSTTSWYPALCVLAFSGSHASPYEAENGSGGTAATMQAGSGVSPSEDNELVIAAVAPTDGSGNIAIDGGFTKYDVPWTSGVNEGCGIGYLIQTSKAAANPTWTMDASSPVTAAIACFKAAAGASPKSNPPFTNRTWRRWPRRR